ncbi:hypothetical protein H2200_005883 [Cladophialophora chaetospira]|uniref:Ankyrin repeat protein n=1 Tax=Cladophialophora chaetospira TaxID=386627 RepID=A0AA39CIJ1_9EURO|nr:hypothetical protein H2200_005883 [Cladophialophora chaetospira]
MALAVSNSVRFRVSLSFPRLLPPDTDFFFWIRTGDHQRVRELLSCGTAHIADVAAPYGLSSLQLATIHNQVEVIEVLIAAGALHIPPLWNWSPRDMYDHYATHSLIQSNLASNELIQDLHKIYAPSVRRPADKELLCLEGGHLTRLHKIVLGLSSEALENVPLAETRDLLDGLDSFNRTALYWAAKLGDAGAVRHLLALGADPGVADIDGALPLHVSVGQGNIDCVRLLAASGAQLEVRDRTGATPMHYACSKADPTVIDVLLEFGADIEATNCVGESPIYRASHARRGDVVRHLAERGASLQHRDSWGYIPLQDTVMMDSYGALTYLISRSDTTSRLFDGKTLLHTCALHSGIQTIEILLQNDLGKIDPYAKDDAGFTALDYLWQRKDATELSEAFCALILKVSQNNPEEYNADADVDVFEDAVAFQQ